MKKKVLSLVLALLMAASSASAVLAEEAIADVEVEETAVVEEVAEAGQYDKAIAFLANYGIFKGISADDLGADLDVERYQMALFVARVSTGWVDDSKWEDGPENWSEFTDISEGPVANYWGALSYVNAKGIIEGYGNGKFGPTDGITYQNALTMTVRTLGYTGLEWPWGYIEKAVSLGLTDGITDVAYTDELTRGEVAQIIYNAMFAKTKNGSTLGLDNFGIEFGWEKVIVTASDLNTFAADKADAALVLKSDNATRYYKDSNKPAAGLVNFQILNDDGTLADDVYTVNAAALGLVGEHDDELAVGDAYYVLFEQNKDEEFVEVVAYEPLYTETLVNAGKTDDEGEDVDYEINEWIDAHSLVSKYSSNAYINMTKPAKDEAIVFVADNSSIEVVTGSDYAIAIDWATGDILVPVDTDKDDDWKDEWKEAKGDAKKLEYTLKYSWNDTLKKYYEVVFDRDIDKFEDVAINWISEAEMEKLLKDYTYDTKTTVKGFNKAVDGITKSAYAALRLFDTNLDGAADRGIYETYRLGYFENKGNNYNCGCGALDSYVISDVNTVTEALAAYKAKEGKDSTEIKVSLAVREEGLVCKHVADRAWIVDDSVLVAAVDEEGEETGYYAPAYVLYNYDAETGALKIVKNITAGEDVDSFVTKGVVRAYNVNKGTITIGEEEYDFNNYAELLGNGFRYATDSVAAKSVYSALLRNLFNQYVKAVVVDGELVHISAIGKDDDAVIVVESYAGLSSDGYIVVNGYSTADLEYTQFRIASYDGWMQGDYYYYLTEDKAEASFTKGAVYTIASYDADEDVYNVNLAGEFTADGYEVENGIVTLAATKLVAEEDGYLVKTTKDGSKTIKMDKNDKYVFVMGTNAKYASIEVYEGKLPADAVIEGDVIDYIDGSSDTYVFVNVTTLTGIKVDEYNAGLVVLLRDSYFSAAYNGEGAEDWYLLGAAEYEVNVVDLLTGSLDTTKFATNKKYDKGLVYYTQGDVLTVNDGEAMFADDIVKAVKSTYWSEEAYIANELGDVLGNTALFTSKKDANKKELEAQILADVTELKGSTKVRGDKVDGITYRVIEIDEDGYVTDINDKIGANDAGDTLTKYAAKNDMTKVPAFYIYNVEAETAVLYIVASDAEITTVDEDKTQDITIVDTEDCDIIGTVVYDEKVVDGKLDSYIVKGVKFAFDPSDDDARHALIAEKGWHFGRAGKDNNENYTVTYTTSIAQSSDPAANEEVLCSIVAKEYTYTDCGIDCDDCKLVQAVYVEFEEAVVIKVTDLDGNGKFESPEGAENININVTISEINDNGDSFNVDLGNKITDGAHKFVKVACNLG